MLINGVRISEDKLTALSAQMPEDILRFEYDELGLSGTEISIKYGMSESWICKLRKIYGIDTDSDYRMRRNSLRLVGLSQRQKDFLYGTLLGDSCIAAQGSGTGYWLCRHSTKQEKYLLKQAEIMKPFTAKVWYGERAFEDGGKFFPYISSRSFALRQFTELREELYPEGAKTVSSKWLEKLTPSGFAFWFMDDGSTTGYGFDITTYDEYFRTEESKEVLSDCLNLKVSIRWDKEGEGRIHVLKESHDIAWEYIASEITTDLYHKTPKRFQGTISSLASEGNPEEGSTTEGSLTSKEYGDNTYSKEAILLSTPSICEKQMVIQSELAGNCER